MATRKQTPEQMIATGLSFVLRIDNGDMPSDSEVQELKYIVGQNLGLTIEQIDGMSIEDLTAKVHERIKEVEQFTRPQMSGQKTDKKLMN